MADEITERIRQIMQELGYSPSFFADEIGIQRPAISHILSGRNRPSLDMVLKILKSFPQINPHWLLTGAGPMKQLNLFGEEEESPKTTTSEDAVAEKRSSESQIPPSREESAEHFDNQFITDKPSDISSEGLIPSAPGPEKPVTSISPATENQAGQVKKNPEHYSSSIQNVQQPQAPQTQSFAVKPDTDTLPPSPGGYSYPGPPPESGPSQASAPLPPAADPYTNQSNANQFVGHTSGSPLHTWQPPSGTPPPGHSTFTGFEGFSGPKKIDKIVIFYADKTFGVYHPE